MKNFKQTGATIALLAPYDVVSGAGLLVGSIFGVANTDATSGASVETSRCGVFDLAKTETQVWAQGAKLYWDNTAKVATTTASGNTVIGAAAEAAANPSLTGTVLLDGTIR